MENLKRMAECWNAFAGVANPAAELARLREQEAGAAALRECLENFRSDQRAVQLGVPAEVTAALATTAGRDLLAQVAVVRLQRDTLQIQADSLRREKIDLLAEVERLRASEARLRTAVNGLPAMIRQAVSHLDAAKVGGTVMLESYAGAIEAALANGGAK